MLRKERKLVGIFLPLDKVLRLLKTDEGERLFAYQDSEGHLTIGIGHLLDNGISKEVSRLLFFEDIYKAQKDCIEKIPCYLGLNEARRYVLTNMCFNLGITRLLGFKKMLACLEREDWPGAANEMLDSKWAGQVKSRATRLYEIMLKGEW